MLGIKKGPRIWIKGSENVDVKVDLWTSMLDKISIDFFRKSEKVRESQLRWFGHVRRRRLSVPVRRVEDLMISGLRREGRS